MRPSAPITGLPREEIVRGRRDQKRDLDLRNRAGLLARRADTIQECAGQKDNCPDEAICSSAFAASQHWVRRVIQQDLNQAVW